MNPEEIKKGEIYKLELLCILNKENVIIFETPTGDHIPLRNSDIECVSPANGTKNTETTPKYDPCRLFREGDKVLFRKVNNRFTYELDKTLFVGTLGRVAFDERESGAVKVHCFDGVLRVVDANYLELVTPVEELEPWEIDEDDPLFWGITKAGGKAPVMLPKAYYTREQAEAERDRLNAEWRKELE